MWGIIPAAGKGTRIQPLAFSKELLPLGRRVLGEAPRPCAVSEYLVQRMLRAGADKLCFIIAPGKADILEYYGARVGAADIAYVVQPEAQGLCDALFRAHPLLAPDEHVLIGLPDTVWFPEDALARLPRDALSFLLFPVSRPEVFDAVLLDDTGWVREIRVKSENPGTEWVWGAFAMPAATFLALRRLWLERNATDEYIGTLVNAYLASGGRARGIRAGTHYLDVGTLDGYQTAMELLRQPESVATPAPAVTRLFTPPKLREP
jgi:dTDP-glucose pyrophosphorylase